MGEVAEMMLDGTLCCQCGEYIGTDNGYPTMCGGCEAECDEAIEDPKYIPTCPHCGKHLRTKLGVQQHIAAKHPQGRLKRTTP